MPAKPAEAKTAILNLRIRPSVKALAEEMAQVERRSVTSYLEILIEADAEKRGLKLRKAGVARSK